MQRISEELQTNPGYEQKGIVRWSKNNLLFEQPLDPRRTIYLSDAPLGHITLSIYKKNEKQEF